MGEAPYAPYFLTLIKQGSPLFTYAPALETHMLQFCKV